MTAGLARNFALLTASNILAPFFSIALVLAISRLQGAETLGKYSLVMTVFVLGQNCATLGLPIIITREVAAARERAGRYFVTACATTLVLVAPIVLVACLAVRALVAEGDVAAALGLVLLALVPSVVTSYAESIFLAFERAADFVFVGLAESLLRAAAGTVLVLMGFGVIAIAATILSLRLVTAVALVVMLRRRGVVLAPALDGPLSRELLRHVPVVGSIPVVNALYGRADILMLTWLGSWADVGLYSAAQRLVDVARTVPPAYGRALYPVLARLHHHAPEEFARASQRALRNVLVLMGPMALLLSGLAGPIVDLLYGAELAPAADALRVLAWTLIPVGVGTTLAQMLFSANRQAVDLRVNLVAMVVAVVGTAVCVPRFGAVGAAAVMLLAATLHALLQYVFVRQRVADPSAIDVLVKLLIVAGASSVLTAVVATRDPIVAGVVGLGAYAIGTLVTGLVSRRDLDRVRLYLVSTYSGTS